MAPEPIEHEVMKLGRTPQPEVAFGLRLQQVDQVELSQPQPQNPAENTTEPLNKDATPTRGARVSERVLSPVTPETPQPAPRSKALADSGSEQHDPKDRPPEHHKRAENIETPLRVPAPAHVEAPVPNVVQTAPKIRHAEIPQAQPTAEPRRVEIVEKPAPPLAPVAREISLRLTQDQSKPVDVRVVEKLGRVEVAVRTPDVELTSSLRRDLGELVGNLEREGYRTEAWHPAGTHIATQTPDQDMTGSEAFPQSSPRENPQQHSGGGRQQREEQRRPEWMEELDDSLAQKDSSAKKENMR